jgi:hypothetical protein
MVITMQPELSKFLIHVQNKRKANVQKTTVRMKKITKIDPKYRFLNGVGKFCRLRQIKFSENFGPATLFFLLFF